MKNPNILVTSTSGKTSQTITLQLLERDFIRLAKSIFSNDEPDWQATHDPSAGCQTDVPNISLKST
jgi:hypothetical protein